MEALYLSVRDQFTDNAFGQPLHLVSRGDEERTSADLSAVLEHPFETFVKAFKEAENWCEIMMLHLNVKYCEVADEGEQDLLTVFVGRKHEQSLESAHRGEYVYRVTAETENYFQVSLNADKGPFRTRNYRIMLEAVPLDQERTFIHFSYAYDFGILARTAKSLYFHTAGRDKVGFTLIDGNPNQPEHIGGVRGALERNIMRYYLALQAYLNGLAAPPAERLERRLEEWFSLTERYPRQLHELNKNDYLRMKREEFKRLEAGCSTIRAAGAM